MSWQLEVLYGTVQTYDATLVEAGDYATAESMSSDSVEIEDIEVSIHGTFLGADTIFDLPADDAEGNDNWRARLLYGGTEIINGIIRRAGGVVHDPDDERWNITVLQAAPDEFLEALEAVRLVDEDLYPTSDITDNLAADGRVLVGLSWMWRIDRVWEAVIAASGVTFTSDPILSYSVDYLDSLAAVKTITRQAVACIAGVTDVARTEAIGGVLGVSSVLPDWTGKTLFEALQVMHGWRVRVTYGAFPSRAITATVIPDAWTDPASPVVLDGLIEDEGRAILEIAAPDNDDLAMAYTNPVYAKPFQSLSWTWRPPLSLAVFDAVAERRIGPEGEPDHDTVLDLPFALPCPVDDGTTRITGYQPDAANHPEYTETVVLADLYTRPEDDDETPLLIAIHEETPGVWKHVKWREVETSTPVGQPVVTGELFPATLLRNYDLSLRDMFVLDATFDTSEIDVDAFRVGDPAYGVSLLGRSWLVESREYEVGMERVRLVLRSLAGARPVYSGGGGTADVGVAGVTPSAAVTCDEATEEWDIAVTWGTPAYGSAPFQYTLEWWPFYGDGWEELYDWVDQSYAFSVPAQGDRGQFRFRLQVTDADGMLSPWMESVVSTPLCGYAPIDPDWTPTDPGDPGEDEPDGPWDPLCFETVRGEATIYAGSDSTRAIPSPAMSVPLNDSTQVFYYDLQPIGNISPASFVRPIQDGRTDSFLIQANAPVAENAKVTFFVRRFRKEVAPCNPACWRIDTHHYSGSSCAPFGISDLGYWEYTPGEPDATGIYLLSSNLLRYTFPTVEGPNYPEPGATNNVFTAQAITVPAAPDGGAWSAASFPAVWYSGSFEKLAGYTDSGSVFRVAHLRMDLPTATWTIVDADVAVTSADSSVAVGCRGAVRYLDGWMVYGCINSGTSDYTVACNYYNGTSWSRITDSPVVIDVYSRHAAYCDYRGETYFFGVDATGAGATYKKVYSYSGSWYEEEDLPGEFRNGSVAVDPEDPYDFYLTGGYRAVSGFTPITLTTLWTYDGDVTDRGRTQLPRSMEAHVSFFRGGVLYYGLGEYISGFSTLAQKLLHGYVPKTGILNPFTGEESV